MTGIRVINDLRSRQSSFNASSRDQWDRFDDHRRRVTQLLAAEATRGRSRLCVLGAGNANDLDLRALLEVYREVHLVDLDGEALAQGSVRQEVTHHRSLHLHGGIDLTGMLDTVTTWNPISTIEKSHFHALTDWPVDRAARALPGEFDVVVSTCLLSQLMETATYTLGRNHARLASVTQAILAGHLRLMASLNAAGGRAILVTEVISSDTLPELASLSESKLEGMLNRLEQEGKVFRGVHPFALAETLRRDPVLRDRVTHRETAGVWRWRLHSKDYLTWALRFWHDAGKRTEAEPRW